MAERYDAILIGTGQSAPALAARLSREGMKVAVIERHKLGGTCVNTGCIPTKTLVASAKAAYIARRGADFGVVTGDAVTVDMKAVKARKDRVAGASNQGVTRWIEGMAGVTLIRGHARFAGPHSVAVGEALLEAERIFLNTGARAFVPPIPGLAEVPYLTNSGMMEVDFLPLHLLILGGSYIGLEFAQMYRRFGSAVTIVEQGPRLIPRDDDDVAQAVREILEGEGVRVCLETRTTRVERVERRGGGLTLHLSGPAGAETLTGSHLLVAVGRRPNSDDLDLERAGIATDARGYIVVDDQLRTSASGVWALGDVNGRGAFTHTSYNDHEIVVANLFDHDPRRVSERILCYGLFIDPPLGRAGLTEREVRASGRPALMANMPMTRVSRAREMGETRGFMKVLVDAETQAILGAAILGVGGDEVVHGLLDAMYARAPYTVIQRAVHIHPTVSELVPTLLGELKPLA
ncbi:MAG: FAD-containing oxidoreductase [Candidatus Lambdaproteobacteria bacterium]|nr:FAD-containing oxidoreductase [Candidatus Lambdaproteobacteria bacterium]